MNCELFWRLSDRMITITRTLVMGILNLTPDSFSDGGSYLSVNDAVNAAIEMERSGADIIDVGAESTRPGFAPVDDEDEWARLEPFFAGIKNKISIPISIDTYHPQTAIRAALAGARIINDVTGFKNPAMCGAAAETGAGIILMHCDDITDKSDAISEVRSFFAGFDSIAKKYGIRHESIMLDAGIGFGKSMGQNLELIRRCGEVRVNNCPVLIGASRKRVVGFYINNNIGGDIPPGERDPGTVAAHTAAILAGANVIRVHNVPAGVQCARMSDGLRRMD